MNLLTSVLICLSLSSAQSTGLNSNWNQSDPYRQVGKLATVRLVLGEPLRIYIAGHEQAAVNLKDFSIQVRNASLAPGRALKIDRHGDYFTMAEPLDLSGASILEVTTKLNNQSETLKFTIPNKKP